MPSKVTYQFADSSDIFDTFEDAISEIEGFSAVLDLALFQEGGSLKHHSSAIMRLLDRTAHDLEQVRQALETREKDYAKKEKVDALHHQQVMDILSAKEGKVDDLRDAFLRAVVFEEPLLQRVADFLKLNVDDVRSTLFYASLPGSMSLMDSVDAHDAEIDAKEAAKASDKRADVDRVKKTLEGSGKPGGADPSTGDKAVNG